MMINEKENPMKSWRKKVPQKIWRKKHEQEKKETMLVCNAQKTSPNA